MSELNLSSDARHRLWQCYALLLKLADQAEQDAADSEVSECQESVAPADNSLPQSQDDDSQAGISEQPLKTKQIRKAQINQEAAETAQKRR